jgi:hypothetical protein
LTDTRYWVIITLSFQTSLNQLIKANGAIMDQQQIIVNMDSSIPLMHPDLFAEKIGRSAGVVGGWIDSGYLPTVKIGRYQLINLALLTENLKQGKVLKPITTQIEG